ncbi:MAG: hypothetical protein GOP50_02425 [Candidatus Heimdallarchaeota archaeon]|nr:hypothetical protein [Candidatus Heimdallarchaeota archaeon]
MVEESPINFELCVVCKTSRMLCGRRSCPLLNQWSQKYSIEQPKIENLDDSFTPPAFFVGWTGYPKINAGPMLTVNRLGSEYIDNANNWENKTQEDIVKMRISLLRTRSKIDVKRPLDSDIIQKSQEMLLGKKAIDVEVTLEKKIIPRIALDERMAPYGPIVPIKKLDLTENQSPITAIEKAYYDTDLIAADAVNTLGKEKLDVHTITRVFSAGMLGRKDNRKLVPTRWSIAAVDDIISKQNAEITKKFQELGEIRIFSNVFFGNRFVIMLVPDVWSYEMIEVWFQGAFMNPSNVNIGVGDYEWYDGRTEYASNVTGAYYAARLAVTEYLMKIQRQAQVIVLREISDEYRFPLGVWVIRVGVRGAMRNKHISVDTIDQAFELLPNYFQYPVKYWKNKSKMYDYNKKQTKLDMFLSS